MNEHIPDILIAISAGSSLRKACEQRGIPLGTVWSQLNSTPEMVQQYARAIQERADYHAEEMMDLADKAEGLDNNGIQALRLMVDTRKWIASKLRPQRYGDKLAVSGDPEGAPVQVSVVEYKVGNVAPLAPARPALAHDPKDQ